MNTATYSIKIKSTNSSFLMLLSVLFFLLIIADNIYAVDTLGVWNVKQSPNPAIGNGINDDGPAIQTHIDAAYNAGGGIVFFPAGNYRITSPLKLHSKVYFNGVGGSTFAYGSIDPSSWTSHFKDSLSCKITLDPSARCNMIETDSLFYQSGIENIALVENRVQGDTAQTNDSYHGIHIPDIVNPNNITRSQAIFRNIIIYETKGTGFYNGLNQHEINLSYVMIMKCGWNGFTIQGMDCKIEHSGAGGNFKSGFYFPTQGSDRIYDVDAWENNIGFEFRDCLNIFFFGIQSNANYNWGVYIGPNVSLIEFYRGQFSFNSRNQDGGYSDVYLTESPTHILFQDCQFKGGDPFTARAKYPIEDVSATPYRNVIANCDFYVSKYYNNKIINNYSAYQIRDCMYEDVNGSGVYGTNSMNYKWTPTNYTMNPLDGQINASAGSGPITITLPDLNLVSLGTVFYISKGDYSTNSIIVSTQNGQTINYQPSVSIGQYMATLMITQAGSQWIATKMTAP